MEGQREGESRLRGYFGLYFSMFHHAVFKHLMFGLLNILIFLLTKPLAQTFFMKTLVLRDLTLVHVENFCLQRGKSWLQQNHS